MSLLSKYYYKKYMMKTLADRVSDTVKDDMIDIIKRSSNYSLHHESYESATKGFFASSGNLTEVIK